MSLLSLHLSTARKASPVIYSIHSLPLFRLHHSNTSRPPSAYMVDKARSGKVPGKGDPYDHIQGACHKYRRRQEITQRYLMWRKSI